MEARLLETVTAVATKRYEYDRITGAQLKQALRDLDKTLGWFAKHYGVPRGRVIKWVDDREDIPFNAIGWLAMASLPGGIERLELANRGRIRDLRSYAGEDED